MSVEIREHYEKMKELWILYGDYAVLLLVSLCYFIMDVTMLPFQRQFSLDDLTISHPHAKHERVPTMYLGLITLPLPGLILYGFGRFRKSPLLFWKSLMGLLYSTMISGLIVTVIKNTVGRPRPDFIARCDPLSSSPHTGLVDLHVCTTSWESHTLQDGLRSFPSGHTAFSFAGLGYLSLIIASQLRMFRKKTSSWAIVMPILPLMLATWIGISRNEDYRHHVEDIVVGGFLGMTIAYVCYRQTFPPLNDALANIPYAQLEIDEGNLDSRRVVEEMV
ncbi:diacylglycerol diphosphate phosphatase [Schizosaccharomyces osmophilus]|uniref:Diacylglycerol diphosphate phosphatase n=1 Tax=Schizosaccharomyces osmophilus TaxID=2545709 RepID=A0AAE9W8F0_9SCHI|nr:diacylglycerol diphosphate phosphatase [Schizosaccharomyces osmophilus]WBW71275.1 diacylglycerol diphosphate phosphatase [Schizosaccharomyces osmophilus]